MLYHHLRCYHINNFTRKFRLRCKFYFCNGSSPISYVYGL